MDRNDNTQEIYTLQLSASNLTLQLLCQPDNTFTTPLSPLAAGATDKILYGNLYLHFYISTFLHFLLIHLFIITKHYRTPRNEIYDLQCTSTEDWQMLYIPAGHGSKGSTPRPYYRHYFIYQDYWSYNMYGHIRHYWKQLEPYHNLNLFYFSLLDWISINIFNYV